MEKDEIRFLRSDGILIYTHTYKHTNGIGCKISKTDSGFQNSEIYKHIHNRVFIIVTLYPLQSMCPESKNLSTF